MSPASNTIAPSHGHSNTSITVILTITLLIFFIIGFFAIYFCRSCLQRFVHSRRPRHSPSGNLIGQAGAPPVQGLDPAIINAFPSFVYSTVKEYRKEKYGLECAICLCEFQDTNILRLLTSCSHVFHQDCIDLWLESHRSCPVCRRTPEAPEMYQSSPDVVSLHMHDDVSSQHSVRITIEDDDHDHVGEREGRKEAFFDSIQDQVNEPGTSDVQQSSPDVVSIHMHDDDSSEHTVRITIEDDDHDHVGESKGRKDVFLDSIQDQVNEPGTSNVEHYEEQEEETEIEKFSRSKTTGHSIVKGKELKENKYMLILPDHIKAKLIRGHNVTRSDTTFGEFKTKTATGHGGFGEVSELSRVGEVSESSGGDDNKV